LFVGDLSMSQDGSGWNYLLEGAASTSLLPVAIAEAKMQLFSKRAGR
jgi:hypothetical protein